MSEQMLQSLQDEFGKMNEANIQHAAGWGTLKSLLIERDIFTEEEFDRRHALAVHVIEQDFARRKEEAIREAKAGRLEFVDANGQRRLVPLEDIHMLNRSAEGTIVRLTSGERFMAVEPDYETLQQQFRDSRKKVDPE